MELNSQKKELRGNGTKSQKELNSLKKELRGKGTKFMESAAVRQLVFESPAPFEEVRQGLIICIC